MSAGGGDPDESVFLMAGRMENLMLTGERAPQVGPDGTPLQRGLRTSVKNNTLSITGAMQALHVVGDVE